MMKRFFSWMLALVLALSLAACAPKTQREPPAGEPRQELTLPPSDSAPEDVSSPAAAGRRYTECDIDTLGAKSRGAKRVVFSNDGLVYYTGDHYASFELLYGEV